MSRSLLILATLASPAAALAQENPPHGNTRPDTVVVTATRTERDLADVAATVSLKTEEDIEREIARDVRDLVRYEPGVSVGGTGDRFGLGAITIRGIGGNRVLT